MERKVHYHGYNIERTAGPNGGMYTIWDGLGRRLDEGGGFNSVVEAQIYINRLDAQAAYVENDYRRAYDVAGAMIEHFLQVAPENAALFTPRTTSRFAEIIAEEFARLREARSGEDLDLDDEIMSADNR